MARYLCLLSVISTFLVSVSGRAPSSSANATSPLDDATKVCHEVGNELSSLSGVFYPNTTTYLADITLPASFFNRANATCVIEPGTSEDVAIVLTSLRKHAKAPFGVMGWGHNLNKGFSSTDGVLIALARFDQLNIKRVKGPNNQVAEVDIGPGLSWDQVYAQVVPQGVNVVGGRFATVGVSGLLLGGGYAWIANEHALGSDNVISYTLVSPKDSSIQEITNSSNPDIFFALKGGLNNFGIVTNFKVKGYPQENKVWAGTVYTQPGNSDAVAEALADFSVNNTDPNAQVIGTFAYGSNQAFEVLVLFYNGEEKPAVFDKFLSFPRQPQSDFSLRTFDNFTSASLATVGFLNGGRKVPVSFFKIGTVKLTSLYSTRYSTLAVEGHPLPVVKSFQSQRDQLGPVLNAMDPRFFGSWTVEPFLKSYWDTAVPSAVPHTKNHVTFPPNIEYTWFTPESDDFMFGSIANTTTALIDAAIAAGQNVSNQIIYPNYALPDTPLENLYGDNVEILKRIRKQADPEGVMLRTGGFKIV